MRIDIWSDVICPWCYLGVHRFQQALAEVRRTEPSFAPEVRLHAFELDPRAPAEPQDLRATLERKYGAGSFDAMTERLTRLGDAEGIDYRFDLAKRVNTFRAHRLLLWAATAGSSGSASDASTGQLALANQLFEAYFTHGADIGDPDVLVTAAVAVGFDGEAARAVAVGDALTDEVRADERTAHELGITGVPAFVMTVAGDVEDGWLVPGAQDVDTFVRVLDRLRERAATTAGDRQGPGSTV